MYGLRSQYKVDVQTSMPKIDIRSTQEINSWEASQDALQYAEQFACKNDFKNCDSILEQVVCYLKQQAEQKNAQASFQIGKVCIMRQTFFSDPEEKVFEIFKQAQCQSCSENILLRNHDNKFGTWQNFREAFEYFEFASNQGHPEAPWVLSQWCLDRVDKSFDLIQGNPLDTHQHCSDFEHNEIDLKCARHWLVLAIKNGSQKAFNELEKRDPQALEALKKTDTKIAAMKNSSSCVLL